MILDAAVHVPDAARHRITEFTLEGRIVGTRPVPGEGVYPVDWRAHPAGVLAFRALTTGGPDLVLHLVGDRLDTLHAFRPDEETAYNTLLPPTAVWDVTPAGALAVGRSDRTALDLGEWRSQRGPL